MCCYSKSQHSHQIERKRSNGEETASGFRIFKMAAAAMLNSGYQEFLNIKDVLSFEGATIPPNLVKISQKLREQHQFFANQDGGNHHVEVQLLGVYRYHRYVVIQSRNIPTKFSENWFKKEWTASVFELKDGGSGHVDFRSPDVFRYHRCVVIRTRNIPTKLNLVRIGQEMRDGISFSKFNVVATAMLDSG